jgi:hypothetical protein
MSTNLEQSLEEKIRALAPEQQQKVLDFVEGLIDDRPKGRSLWEMARDCMKNVPQEVLDELPVDASENLDHYLYGSPK